MRDEFNLPAEAPGVYMPLRADQPYHKAYFPDNLPITLEMSEEIVKELARAMHALGRLDGLGSEVEDPSAIFSSFVYKEAEQSSQVEGTAVTVSDIYQLEIAESESISGSEAEGKNIREARNYIQALETGIDYLKTAGRSGESITLEFITSLHETLMERGRSDEEDPLPGELRPGLALITETDEQGIAERVRFAPPPESAVENKMVNLVQYIQSTTQWPDLVDIGLVHYQFETIHPFIDGNGRVGRLLIVLLLLSSGIVSNPLIYPSSYFKRHREEYTNRLLAVSEQGEWRAWLAFFLRAIREQAEEAFVRAKLLSRQQRQYEVEYADAAKSTRLLTAELFSEPYFSVSEAAEAIQMTYQSANNATEQLVTDGVVAEITGNQQNRIFKATEVMDIIERPANELPEPNELIEENTSWRLTEQ